MLRLWGGNETPRIYLASWEHSIWPRKVEAQQPLWTIAIIGNTPGVYGPWASVLVERLGQLGWIEGRTLQVEYRWSEGRRERVVEIASELVSKKIDLIVTYGSAAVILKQKTASIPIVFVPAVDPIAAGLVDNLAHPGGNTTRMSVQQAEIASKRLEVLRDIVPGLGRLAILFDASYSASVRVSRPAEFHRQPLAELSMRTLASLSSHQANVPVIPSRQCTKRPAFS